LEMNKWKRTKRNVAEEKVRYGTMFCYEKLDDIIAKDWREDVKV